MAAAQYWFDGPDGLRLFSRVYAAPTAAAPVVVCLHGLMRNGRDFEDLAEHLCGRYRVIVPDVRGRGLSARDPNFNNYQIPVYLNDLLLLCAGLGIGRASIIGTSMGGLMAMVLAVMQPQLVAGVVRPEDIESDNTIDLPKIAEARVAYGGKGELTDIQRSPWGQHALDIVLPF